MFHPFPLTGRRRLALLGGNVPTVWTLIDTLGQWLEPQRYDLWTPWAVSRSTSPGVVCGYLVHLVWPYVDSMRTLGPSTDGFLPVGVLSTYMDATLDDIQFLANSANRIQVLEALTSGAASRRELQDATGVPRSTAARVLDDAEARGWVRSAGSRYRITSLGEAMVTEFRRYLAGTEGIHHLGPAIDWLPEPAWDLDFRCFREAEVTTPTEANPTAHFDRAMEYLRESDSYRGLTQNSLPEYMKVLHGRVVEGQLDFEGVVEASFIDVLGNDPDRAALWRDLADRMWLYNGRVPLNMHIADGTVLVWLCGENQAGDDVLVKGLLESTHSDVVSWAESLYEEHRADAEPLEPVVLPPK